MLKVDRQSPLAGGAGGSRGGSCIRKRLARAVAGLRRPCARGHGPHPFSSSTQNPNLIRTSISDKQFPSAPATAMGPPRIRLHFGFESRRVCAFRSTDSAFLFGSAWIRFPISTVWGSYLFRPTVSCKGARVARSSWVTPPWRARRWSSIPPTHPTLPCTASNTYHLGPKT